jgi:regulator of sigma E protease
MSIFAAIVALCVVIVIHEAGHYLAAVWTGMKVDRFSVFGIGPAILKLGTWRGTEFVISAIPFGAFVLIRGMEPGDDEPGPRSGTDAIDDDAWAKAIHAAKGGSAGPAGPAKAKPASPNFRDKPLWARAAVLAGGPLANYLAAMVLVFGLFSVVGKQGQVTHIEVTEVFAGLPAATAGLEVGDRIIEIGGTTVEPKANIGPVIEVIQAHAGKPLEITIERRGQTVFETVEPNDEGKIGAGLAGIREWIPVGAGEATLLAVEWPLARSKEQLVGLYQYITRQIDAEMQGPVGIVKGIASSIERGLVPFITMTALISTLLGLFNLLPLPALDGGRLSFLAYEALARRRANGRTEELVHGYGMLALLSLIAVVTLRELGVIDKIRSIF